MDHSHRGSTQKGSTQRQVVKKEIKLEAVDDSLLNDTILLNHRLMCNHPDHRSGQSQGQLQEFQQRIQDLEKKGAEKDKKIANLTSDAETFKVTLDEKQKRIGELEGSLNDKTKKVVELEKSLLKAGRVLQGFVIDLQKKEKELEQLKIEATLKRQKMDPLIAPVKKLEKRNINENESENPTPDVQLKDKLSNHLRRPLGDVRRDVNSIQIQGIKAEPGSPPATADRSIRPIASATAL